jgi:transposase
VLDRHDLTDEEWALLEPLLPSQKPQRGGRWADHRTVINGVFWRTRCGLPWRDVPPNYGHWKTVYNRHRRWSADGIWEGLLDVLRRDADRAEGAQWMVGIDAGVVRAHQHAAGARHRPPADVPAEVVAPVEVDTGGRVESQENGRGVDGEAQPGDAGSLPRRADLQDSPRR